MLELYLRKYLGCLSYWHVKLTLNKHISSLLNFQENCVARETINQDSNDHLLTQDLKQSL